MRVFDVWMEGFLVQGMEGPARARCIGRVEATTFQEACDLLCESRTFQERNGKYDKKQRTVWGCRLFDNEVDARRTFG